MKISYSILTHNETDSLEKLLKFLVKWKQPEDEIVILDDSVSIAVGCITLKVLRLHDNFPIIQKKFKNKPAGNSPDFNAL